MDGDQAMDVAQPQELSVAQLVHEELTDSLNQPQKEAVTAAPEGALVILAGPGSGKTRAVCYRVAYLIKYYGIMPRNVVLVTFTNKAANEMKERIVKLLGLGAAQQILMGTFHSTCAKLLRMYGSTIGLSKDFQIIDYEDSKVIMKNFLKESEEWHTYDPATILDEISNLKNNKMTAKQFQSSPKTVGTKSFKVHKKAVVDCYLYYESELERLNFLDFDDLLVRGVELLTKNRDIANKFEHVLVDEFQDTNELQYELTKLMAQKHECLTVVGDPDQAIYGWRRANVDNLTKNINNDYSGKIRMIHLNRGYRSSQNIVSLCSKVIQQDPDRNIAPMITNNSKGIPTSVIALQNNIQEAVMVAFEIKRLMQATENKVLTFADFAILVRTQNMTLAFENAFAQRGIPYKIVGGLRFFDRLEIKDVLAYVHLAENFADEISFGRIINIPARGLGEVTVTKIKTESASAGIPCLEYCRKIVHNNVPHDVKPAQLSKLKEFIGIVDQLRKMIEAGKPVHLVVEKALELSQYEKYLHSKYDKLPGEFETRWGNIIELLGYATQFDEEVEQESLAGVPPVGQDDSQPIHTPMHRFLDTAAMGSDHKDKLEDNKVHKPQVVISTLHSAKGLEWPCVFVVGVEDELLPHKNSQDNAEQIKEERRLLYVGMSRAQYFLYVSFCGNRWMYNQTKMRFPSPFLRDVLKATGHFGSSGYSDDSNMYMRRGSSKSVVVDPASVSNAAPTLTPQSIAELCKIINRPVFDDLHPPTTSVAFTPASPDRWLQEATVLNEYKKSQADDKQVFTDANKQAPKRAQSYGGSSSSSSSPSFGLPKATSFGWSGQKATYSTQSAVSYTPQSAQSVYSAAVATNQAFGGFTSANKFLAANVTPQTKALVAPFSDVAHVSPVIKAEPVKTEPTNMYLSATTVTPTKSPRGKKRAAGATEQDPSRIYINLDSSPSPPKRQRSSPSAKASTPTAAKTANATRRTQSQLSAKGRAISQGGAALSIKDEKL